MRVPDIAGRRGIGVAVGLATACAFGALNRYSTGPVYLSDEIGYLGHAAVLGGHAIDATTSWHFGYSLFLSPLFALGLSPATIWQGVLVLNGAFWLATVVLLDGLVVRLFPEAGVRGRVIALAGVSLYPGWVILFGYSFTTFPFLFFHVLSVRLMLALGLAPDAGRAIGLGACLGFLYWIHPLGLAAVVAGCAAAAVLLARPAPRLLALLMAVAVAMCLAYGPLHDLLYRLTVPADAPRMSHYAGHLILVRLLTVAGVAEVAARMVMWLGALTVASFGIAASGVVTLCVMAGRGSAASPGIPPRAVAALVVFVLGGLLLATGIGAASLTAENYRSPDGLAHIRYVEVFALPVLLVGLTSVPGRVSAGIVAGVGAIVLAVVLLHGQRGVGYNLVNMAAFWPHYLVPDARMAGTFALGFASVAALLWLAARDRRWIWSLVLLAVVADSVGYVAHRAYRSRLQDHYSNPSPLADVVRLLWPRRTCVGFDRRPPDFVQDLWAVERYKLLLFHLYDYRIRRMSPAGWNADCDGPIFTFRPADFEWFDRARLVGIHDRARLFLVADRNGPRLSSPDPPPGFRAIEAWDARRHVVLEPSGLKYASRTTGRIGASGLSTVNRQGFLLHGAAVGVDAGRYRLEVTGTTRRVRGAWVDVAAAGGRVQHARFAFPAQPISQGILLEAAVDLTQAVADLEVRVFVTADDDLTITGYRLAPIDRHD